MANDTELNAFELDRLDLFATQTLLKCVLHQLLMAAPESGAAAARLADLYDRSIKRFDLQGPPQKIAGSKDYLLNVGHDFISAALNPTSDPR